jgi:uroporphyrinogen decarboxylase
MSRELTSMARVLAALSHQEADRVPLFLLLSVYGAREAGVPIRDYFANPALVADTQLAMWEKYGTDCLYAFFHAPLEVEAMGGEVIFVDNGPPNSGRPVIARPEAIADLEMPRVADAPGLQRVLEAIRRMKAQAGAAVPIIGVVMSPFSLPVMQLGFDHYLELIHGRRDLFDRLMTLNEGFCVEWANAQLAAGATALVYFDPVSSPTIIPRALFLETGLPIARRILPQIQGPVAIHLASGRTQTVLSDLAAAGAAAIGVSGLDDLPALKAAARGKVSLLGNLDGIQMCRWTPMEAEARVREAIAAAGAGGGFILADHHGEIPFQVPPEILLAISGAVRRWGRYPLEPSRG